MQLFGLSITRQKTAPAYPVSARGGWWPVIREPYTGAWQKNDEWTADTVLAYHAIFACTTLIAADVGKLRTKLVELGDDGIWNEVTSAAFSPVLRKPNRFQNHIQFKEWWITSKLVRGNAYVLLERDNRSVVSAMYLLDPQRVKVLAAPDGSVFYELGIDNLAGLQGENLRVPASEIIHDRMNCLHHPLVGVSPLFASGTSAGLGLRIQDGSSRFFANNSNPGGILTAPAQISDATAARLKQHWDENYSGNNSGRVAVLGDGLKFEPMRMTAIESQLIEQLRITAEIVCSTFHVPPYMIGIGQAPTYNNIEALSQQYYSQCLQSQIESMELCLDEALGIGVGVKVDGRTLGTELDLDGLLRMDTATQIATLKAAVDGAIMAPNEARRKVNLGGLVGGDTVYMQQQNYSLAALNARDKAGPPPGTAPLTPAAEASNDPQIAAAAGRSRQRTYLKGLFA